MITNWGAFLPHQLLQSSEIIRERYELSLPETFTRRLCAPGRGYSFPSLTRWLCARPACPLKIMRLRWTPSMWAVKDSSGKKQDQKSARKLALFLHKLSLLASAPTVPAVSPRKRCRSRAMPSFRRPFKRRGVIDAHFVVLPVGDIGELTIGGEFGCSVCVPSSITLTSLKGDSCQRRKSCWLAGRTAHRPTHKGCDRWSG